MAHQARLARAGTPADTNNSSLSDVAVEAVRKIATDAHTVDKAWIDRCQARGLDHLPMVELLAVVAKTVAIDTYLEGVDKHLLPLPGAHEGEPAKAVAEGVRINRGWLPTRGPAGAPVCFSAVAAEEHAWHDLHSALYLSMEDMRDLDIEKDGLHRSQIELLAARTSHYNDCFY